MRKLGFLVFLFLAAIGLAAMPTVAQAAANVAICASVHLTGPADGAELDPDYQTRFSWSAEPRGTASRDFVSVRVDTKNKGKVTLTDGTHVKAQKGIHTAYGRGEAGVYIWFVVFKDAKGRVICMSEQRTYIVGAYSAEGILSNADNSSPAAVAAAKASLGRYIVHLMGYRGTDNTTDYAGGTANWEKHGDSYNDATDAVGIHDWKALGYDGVDIWGNGDDNIIIGSNQGDNIFGLAGNDKLLGKGGDDTINGGDESCKTLFGKCEAGDEIDGGSGNDTINGGNESCHVLVGKCVAGDDIKGGDGDDTINGGDESCGVFIGHCDAGDTISGGKGNDKLNGGGGDDTINGDDGNDTINGNNGEDTLNGGKGNDTINGGAGDDDIDGGPGADTLHGNGGNDTINTGGNDHAPDTGSGDSGFDTIHNGSGGDTVTQN